MERDRACLAVGAAKERKSHPRKNTENRAEPKGEERESVRCNRYSVLAEEEENPPSLTDSEEEGERNGKLESMKTHMRKRRRNWNI